MGRRYEARSMTRTSHSKNNPSKIVEERDRDFIRHFSTPVLEHPNADQILSLDRIGHVWKAGDRFFKLADEYYGRSEYWWVIAWFNQAPTEAHVETGDNIEIPKPLDRVLALMEV
jgi:nucleoid-associated protein YgaU